MDRNEVLLVGRLSAAVEEHPMPSGDTVTKWRIIVRRRRPHRRGGTITDSVPCVTFNREAAAVLRRLKPRDYVEVIGAFRCRVFGPAGAKIWKYEVEVSTAKPIDVTTLSEPVGALPLAAPEDLVARSEPLDAAASSGFVEMAALLEPEDAVARSKTIDAASARSIEIAAIFQSEDAVVSFRPGDGVSAPEGRATISEPEGGGVVSGPEGGGVVSGPEGGGVVFGPEGGGVVSGPEEGVAVSGSEGAVGMSRPEDGVSLSGPPDGAEPSGSVDAGTSAEPVDTAALSAAEEHSPAMATALVPRQGARLARAS
ncbi:single-stranded DNA-binding protein [Nonomuraea sp. SYSU D8015]|uniref:single-stranded DNA-binding protein n=1 Tax=Nonomuraea sp. SYSU D8015 TaxID=2593644 RepID=UPI0016608779|nr:single-stranded DNA-binding protein [Nonomuraea sp. SYSU D8015]